MSSRSDFEVAVLFSTTLGGPGWLKKRGDGTYLNKEAEAAYQGYKMAREGDREELKRFAHDRYLTEAHMRQINKALQEVDPEAQALSEEQVREFLKIVAGWPA